MAIEVYMRKIPSNMNPWVCSINDVEYRYPAGTEQAVPPQVAEIIDQYYAGIRREHSRTAISFNELRDRPFYESTEVLFDQRVEFMDFGGMMVFGGEPPELLETGKTYTVTYNGEKYNCVAFDSSDDGTEVAIGNNIISGMDTGEPFFIITGFDGGDIQEYFFSVLSLNGDTSATVKIEKSVIHTIDPKFLPGGGGKVIYAWNSADDAVVDESGNAVTAEQATKDMFNVVIEDVVDGGYMIPWLVRSGEGYVRFHVICGEEYTNITIGTSPK